MISNCRKIYVSQLILKRISMASRMNSGGSNDSNRIKIDRRTGKKFSFNMDIY